ncbi:MAG TPA: DeoR/GlpR family DNA-binding transcription regulator [Anaeromyxobacter sp.]|nr:DeoR/GlpR family DNA-binding transcription regulator [Anaeromyxobacter sp.]
MKREQIFVEERKRAVVDFVQERKRATVTELCARFEVSPATMRSDLRDLEREGLLVRTHGGATVKEKARFELEAREKGVQHSPEKRAVAQRALEHIEDGDTIVLDTGSTTFQLAMLLGARNNITVVTNDLAIAQLLEEHPTATVHLIGGVVRKRFHCTMGTRAEQFLQGLKVDKAFMAANGFSVESGATTPDMQHAEIKRQMMAIATRILLLVDSSKLGKSSFAQFAPPDGIDCLIVDAVDPAEARALEELGVELELAPLPPGTNEPKGRGEP